MKFTKEMVNSYAEKLLIGLTEEENKNVLEEFEIIDKNIDLINKIENLSNIEPMSYCLDDFSYELDDDIIEESIDISLALKNSDEVLDREISIPKVVG